MAIAIVKPVKGNGKCGFCQTGHHPKCVVGSRNALPRALYPRGSIYLCLCEEGGCTEGRRKCTYCNNRVTEEVNPNTWECFDREHCRALVDSRREANPLYVQLRESRRNGEMAKIQEKEAKAEKVKKTKEPTFCIVTGKPTSGGLFAPGMDARYVSNRVNAVLGKTETEAQARKKMKDDGVSEKLVGKFDKSLGLAKDKAAKKVAAEKERAEAKKAAATEKAQA